MYRTHNCNELTIKQTGESIILSGWVHRRRDHGGLIFIDIRDQHGLTQIVFNPENKEMFEIAEKIRSEYVIQVKGIVKERVEGQTNKNLDTGKIEIEANELTILNKSEVPPFVIDQETEVGEEIRLRYKYLDIRRNRVKNNIIQRSKIIKKIRDFMNKESFLEIETPIMIKGTPEGSREYIVPSRTYPGKFYVLPQSPQQLKQLLMVGGIDKYFQIARCFRDEDLRGDRQPEFTQLDMEMSFVEQEDILNLNEKLATSLAKEFLPQKEIISTPFTRLTWNEAMNNYGSDKPDLRFEMKIIDISTLVKDSGFKVFKDAVLNKGVVKALRVKNGATFTRKEIDNLTELAKKYGAKGLAYISLKEEGTTSPILKFLKEEEIKSIIKETKAEKGDIIFFTADKFETAVISLGQVRLSLGDKFNLQDKNKLSFCWVTEFPLFEKDEETGKLKGCHHPFTAPLEKDLENLEKEPLSAKSKAYDLILNGNEIGGGSIRIHSPELQAKIFKLLGMSDKESNQRFGHIIKAFKFGAPPHGGIAWGIDRLIMIFQEEPNIREVIPFPKDQKGKDLMLGAPSEIPTEELTDLYLELKDLPST